MLDQLFIRTFGDERIDERAEGVAFLRSVASLYNARSVDYFALNIRNTVQENWTSCHFSSRLVRQLSTPGAVSTALQSALGIAEDTWQWHEIRSDGQIVDEEKQSRLLGHFWVVALPRLHEEYALFSITLGDDSVTPAQRSYLGKEWAILGNYFHSHVRRLNGHDSSKQLIVSGRELDCLRWTAAGKTAWEASVILGISERTVRFHLNAAREKLNCATTTQAVAKAVARQMI
jgi:DNA-binding CsgD family transcriptional regulator